MTLQEVKTLLETTGLPVVYYAFPPGEVPELPFLVYFEDQTNPFAADGAVYYASKHIFVELYTQVRDTATEELVETALSGLFYNKEVGYVQDENCYQIAYDLEV